MMIKNLAILYIPSYFYEAIQNIRVLAYELWFWFYPSLPAFIQPSTFSLPLHRRGVVVASGLQDVPAPLGEPQGTPWCWLESL